MDLNYSYPVRFPFNLSEIRLEDIEVPESASFVHIYIYIYIYAQKGIMQQSKHNCGKDSPILYQSLAENVIFTDNRNSFSLILICMKAAVPIKSDLIRRIENGLS